MIKIIPKIFGILEQLRLNRKTSLKTLAVRTGLTKPTLCNILKAMNECGYVMNDGKGNYFLNEKISRLGTLNPVESLISEIALNACRKLADDTRESAVVATLENNRIKIVGQAQFQRSLVLSSSIYKNLSLYHSVSGRIILSGLNETELDSLAASVGFPYAEWDGISTRESLDKALSAIRRKRLSVMENKIDEIKSFAMPFFDADGCICGSIGLTIPLFRMTSEAEKEIYVRLREQSEHITARNMESMLSAADWRSGNYRA